MSLENEFFDQKKINVDVINNEFVCFEVDGFQTLLKKCRIVGSFLNEEKSGNACESCPTYLLPEQVKVLIETGVVIARRVKSFDGFCNEPHSSTTVYDINVEELRQKAIDIAKKRELKSRKRQFLGDNVPSKVMKLKKSDEKDMDSIRVDNLVVEKIMAELTERRKTNPKDTMRVYYESSMDVYEVLSNQDIPLPNDINFRLRLTVFRDLWRKGFYLTSGEKFGCDYLAYESPPGDEHSRFMVYCKGADENILPLDILSLSRVAGQVGKAVLLAVVTSNSVVPSYVEMNWWKGDE